MTTCMHRLCLSSILLVLAACSPQGDGPKPSHTATAKTAAAGEPVKSIAPDLPAGTYSLDKSHTSLLFRVNHLGFSMYTARFKQFDAQLQFDPKNLAASSLTATVDAGSIETDFPSPEQVDFNAQLRGEQWLDTAKYPQMTYRSTKVELTDTDTMRVNGELTLHGVTRPLTLDVTFNGGYTGHPMDPHARIGFSARGSLKRSDYGISLGIPEPGSSMGVGDDVEILIETELSGPEWKDAPKPAS